MVNLRKKQVECLLMNEIIFEVLAKFKKKIRLTEREYTHICKRHPEVLGETDEKVWLFYRFFKETPVTENI